MKPAKTKAHKASVGTRSDVLRRTLENEIISGKLTPGERLDEARLAERFQVSRALVREALRHLASSGLAEMRMRQGAMVRKRTVAELVDSFQVMAELEGLCARLAARRISVSQRCALERACRACIESAEAEDPDAFYRASLAFHETICAASQNKVLEDYTCALRRAVGPYRRYATHSLGRMAASSDEHETVMRAVFAGREKEADDLMRQHVGLLGEEVADLVSAMREDEGELRSAG
jgi:DNA-binding GntR family transcriptional regulator